MNYNFAMHTDVGIVKNTNQDSLCIKQAKTNKGNVLLAIVCDGMGGLEKGEVASASIIKAFSKWFEDDLAFLLAKNNHMEEVRYHWERMIKELNQVISNYGRYNRIQLGSTITALLIFEDGKYLVGHVGDSRLYRITNSEVNQLTLDQTVVANEVRLGRLTVEEAKRDPRRNVLLQCIGASRIVEPSFLFGEVRKDECYMLCSDGFRHVVTQEEFQRIFAPANNQDERIMKKNIFNTIELNKDRGETDNISAILIKIV